MWLKVLFLLVLLPIWVEALDSRIRKANYLFDFEGQEAEALALLTEVQNSGSKHDQSASLFVKARIHDSRNRIAEAINYYKLYLSSGPQDVETMRVVSLRLAELDSNLSLLVKNIGRFPSKPVSRIQGSNPLIQLQDLSLWRLKKGKISRQKYELQNNQVPLYGAQNSLWIWDKNKRSITEVLLNEGSVRSSFLMLDSLIDFQRLESGDWLIKTNKAIEYYSQNKRMWQKNDAIKRCDLSAIIPTIREALLVCGTDTLKAISLRDGSVMHEKVLSEAVDTIFVNTAGIWTIHSTAVRYWKDARSRDAKWQQTFHSIQSVLLHAHRLFVLEENGTLNIMESRTGMLLDKIRIEPGEIFVLGARIGVLSPAGHFTVLDATGRVLWKYHAGKASWPPLSSDAGLYLPLKDGALVSLDPLYHGGAKTDIQFNEEQLQYYAQEKNWDSTYRVSKSILQTEPGNAIAWSFLARSLEEKKIKGDSVIIAWANAAKHSRGLELVEQRKIFTPYAQKIKAKWIQALPFSTQSYPRFFGYGRNVHTIDASNRSLVALDTLSGVLKWRSTLMPLHSGYLMNQDTRWLALTSGVLMQIYDLESKGKRIAEVKLPNAAHQVIQHNGKVYVVTWDGHLMCYNRKNLALIWSIRQFTQAAFLAIQNESLLAVTLSGDLFTFNLNDGVQLQDKSSINAKVEQLLVQGDMQIYALQNGKLAAYQKGELIWSYAAGAQVYSMQFWEKKLFIGLSDQKLVMIDLLTGSEEWVWNGSGSIFVYPSIEGKAAYIDQGKSIAVINLQKGNLIKKIQLQDRSGPVWSTGSSLLATTAQGLLFSFPLVYQENP